jgi:predicted signal transduction protein with EAL and GGDEF domain
VRVAGNDHSGVLRHAEDMGDQLARALDEGQVVAAFEPVIDLRSQELCAVQALARWDHPELGRLPARSFAEEALVTGYADVIWWAATRYALRAAAAAHTTIPVHITLATSQLRDEDVVGRLRSLRELASDAEVHLRVDAHSVLDITAMGQEVIDVLGRDGLRLVLSGHGRRGLPLGLLASLPLAALELDPTLVRDVAENPKAIALATRLASTLDVPCIAQVDDDAELPRLAVLGVTSASGWVTGCEWDADRLAAEMAARRVTPPRPSPSR